jgi:hypothetical protein
MKPPFTAETSSPERKVPVAVYLRAATAEDSDAQAQACDNAIGQHSEAGWYRALLFSDRNGWGTSMSRPGLLALMEAVAAGGIEVVVSCSVDCLLHSAENRPTFQRLLQEHGCQLVNAAEISEDDRSLQAGLERYSRAVRAARADAPQREELVAAVEQLRESARGTQALGDFCDLLMNGGSGLDVFNWQAMSVLVSGCQAGHSDLVLTLRNRRTILLAAGSTLHGDLTGSPSSLPTTPASGPSASNVQSVRRSQRK